MQNYLFPAFIFGETIFGGLTLLFEDEFFVLSLSLSSLGKRPGRLSTVVDLVTVCSSYPRDGSSDLLFAKLC